ncbi:MAG TPA: primosomal protein N' [Acidobacteriaceae bacterium]|nr:primosomal protein N' [Acidobacteriaceae bacterium]
MSFYCDVALPVPVDRTFTYAIKDAMPVAGGRVLVPFRREQMQGIVLALHDQAPPVETRSILRVLDQEPVLSSELLTLGRWIAEYYVAPLGEVLRTMLPLGAEVRHETVYRITERGQQRLAIPAQRALTQDVAEMGPLPAASDLESAALEFLQQNGPTRARQLRSKIGATAATFDALLASRWATRESTAAPRETRRTERFAVLIADARLPKLNENQQRLLAELASVGGRMRVADLRKSGASDSTLGALLRRELVRLEEVPIGVFDAPAASGDLVSSAALPEAMLNEAQRDCLLQIAASVHAGKFQPFLLHGVTGSGKTAVYMAAMRRALDAGLSSLLLVPEIGLTPAMVAQLRASFGSHVALLHSALTGADRTAQWHRIRNGEARVVVGTRSAVFAPVSNLALLIVDEEHDTSYKQADLPRYHARDVAVMRAKQAGATIVLGSATPSLESWSNAQRGRYSLLSMHNRVGQRPLPEVSLIDMRREFTETGQETLLSRALQEEIESTLGRGEQAILLLNRRGYSIVAMCRACGDKLECENCAIALTHHKSASDDAPSIPERPQSQRMECHYCGFRRMVPNRCPSCESEHLFFYGVGSQQGEEKLQEIFPHARIARMDRDTMRHHRDYERILARMQSGEVNLLVGTQMIAKGHDIHGVTLVGVIGLDHALGLPDFRSAERVFQLLTQVAGRAGRGELPGRVLVQTHHPDHYAIRCAAVHDYNSFVDQEMHYRRLLHYPPAAVLTNVLIEHTDLAKATQWTNLLKEWMQNRTLPGVRVIGPAASPISRIKRVYRFHFILKASHRKQLIPAVRQMLAYADSAEIPRRFLTIDVDAVHLM